MSKKRKGKSKKQRAEARARADQRKANQANNNTHGSKGDYCFVRDQNENILGLWFQSSSEIGNGKELAILLLHGGAPEDVAQLAYLGEFRVVPNISDGRGGVFVMFGSAPAPGQADFDFMKKHRAIPPGFGKSSKPDNSGCFIATACYGAADAPQVLCLRGFRDDVLVRTSLGQGFISLYYRYSPPLADWIASRPSWRWFVKQFLVVPVVSAVKIFTRCDYRKPPVNSSKD